MSGNSAEFHFQACQGGRDEHSRLQGPEMAARTATMASHITCRHIATILPRSALSILDVESPFVQTLRNESFVARSAGQWCITSHALGAHIMRRNHDENVFRRTAGRNCLGVHVSRGFATHASSDGGEGEEGVQAREEGGLQGNWSTNKGLEHAKMVSFLLSCYED